MSKVDFVAFKVTTAKAENSYLCQFGIVIVTNRNISAKFHYFIKPAVLSCPECGSDLLKDGTKIIHSFPEAWEKVRNLFTGNLLVAHNARFELSLLRNALLHYKLEVPELYCDCTYRLSGLSLEALCNALKIDYQNDNDALLDAAAIAFAYQKLQQGIKPDYSLIKLRQN